MYIIKSTLYHFYVEKMKYLKLIVCPFVDKSLATSKNQFLILISGIFEKN
jgi:hypothetical protein